LKAYALYNVYSQLHNIHCVNSAKVRIHCI